MAAYAFALRLRFLGAGTGVNSFSLGTFAGLSKYPRGRVSPSASVKIFESMRE